MSKKFEKIKKYYGSGLWNEERVRNATEKGAITEEQYAEVVKNLANTGKEEMP